MSNRFAVDSNGEMECPFAATFRYAWPGKEEQFACQLHGKLVQQIAIRRGINLQLITAETDKECDQKLTPKEISALKGLADGTLDLSKK